MKYEKQQQTNLQIRFKEEYNPALLATLSGLHMVPNEILKKFAIEFVPVITNNFNTPMKR